MSDHSGGSDSGDDENEIVAIKKLKLVHFGSQAEAVKILNRNENEKGAAAGSGVDFSNISTSNGMTSAILNYLYLLVCFCKESLLLYIFFQSIWSSTSKLMQQKRKCWQNLKEGEKY